MSDATQVEFHWHLLIISILWTACNTQDYDGDCSVDEHSMIRNRSSLNAMSTPTSRTTRYLQNVNHIDLDMEGMPPPKFPSEWQLNKPNHGALRKRNLNDTVGHRPGTNTFPIDLDRKGHPTKAVQLGPLGRVYVRWSYLDLQLPALLNLRHSNPMFLYWKEILT